MFYSIPGPAATTAALPEELRGRSQNVDFQVLLPCVESDLQPITVERARESLKSGMRVAPALWQIPGKGLEHGGYKDPDQRFKRRPFSAPPPRGSPAQPQETWATESS